MATVYAHFSGDSALNPLCRRLSILLLAVFTGFGCSAHASGDPVVGMAVPDLAYDQLLAPEARGFLGADGAASVPINSNRVLWIFGDTPIGIWKGGKRTGPMVRNTIAIQDLSSGAPGEVEYYWDLTDRIPGDFFHMPTWEDPHWLWPGTGVSHDGRLFLFLSKMGEGSGPDAFGFQTVGCVLVIVENPLDDPLSWEMTQRDLGVGNDHFNINAAAMVEGDHIILLGYADPGDDPTRRAATLARMPLAALETEHPGSQIEYWTGEDKWESDSAHIAPLFTPGTTETSLHYDESIARYVSVSLQPFQEKIYLFTAEKPTGPWSDAVHIYDVPELTRDDNYVAYAARAHPELPTARNELAITYVVNTRDFWSMFSDREIYFPRFIRVTFETE